MDRSLYEKYKDIKLPVDLVNMYADIVINDEAARKVLIHIGKHTADEEELGLTVGQIVERVHIQRKVQKSNSFVIQNANIDRKHAERVVHSLQMMGLCYYRPVPPSKVINFTVRGKQVAGEIKRRFNNAKSEKGDEENV